MIFSFSVSGVADQRLPSLEQAEQFHLLVLRQGQIRLVDPPQQADNDRVMAGAVAATGQDPDTFDVEVFP